MLPYSIYSIFHVATYTRANLIPTVFPPKPIAAAEGASPNAKPQYTTHPIADSIGAFVKEYYDASMSIVSGLEIALWLRLFVAALSQNRLDDDDGRFDGYNVLYLAERPDAAPNGTRAFVRVGMGEILHEEAFPPACSQSYCVF